MGENDYLYNCEAEKIVYFGAISGNNLDKNQPFSQIISDGSQVYCGTSVFGDPLPGWTKYCFCETLEYYYDTPTPDPATRFVWIDELMLDEQNLTQTGLGELI